MSAGETVRLLWQAFAAHDWTAAGLRLAHDVVVRWPQSGEQFVCRENVISMNRAHPAPDWRMESIEIVAEQGSVVAARVVVPTRDSVDVCVGFYRVDEAAGEITEATEYWTEHASRPTPDWRAQWTSRIDSSLS